MDLIQYMPENPEMMPTPQLIQNDKVEKKKSSVFAEGNLDRFGNQKYPINPPLNVPGPGSYDFADSLEDKANRALIVEEQKKLLKQWYNK